MIKICSECGQVRPETDEEVRGVRKKLEEAEAKIAEAREKWEGFSPKDSIPDWLWFIKPRGISVISEEDFEKAKESFFAAHPDHAEVLGLVPKQSKS